MGTYSRPGLTAGEAALISDPAAALSKAIGGVSDAFNTQMANIQISKDALTKSTAELNQQANSIKTDQGNTLANKTQDILKQEIDRVYRLKYNSIGRDQSEAIKAESDLLGMVKKMPEVMAFYDQEASEYKENIINGRANSTISNLRTNKNSRGFYDNIMNNNGNDITPTYENGQLIFKYGEGKDAFEQNSINYYEGVKKGADSNVGYIDQDKYPAAYKATFNQYSKEFPALIQQIETQNKAGGITDTTKKNYNQQVDLIKNKLMNDKQLLNDIDSDEFQFLVGSSYLTPENDKEVFTGSKEQIERAQLAKVNFIMDQYAKVDQGAMVNGKFVIGDAQTIIEKEDVNLKKKTKTTSRGGSSQSQDAFKPDVDGIIEGIKGLKADPEKGQTYFIGKKIKGREIIKVKYSPENSTSTFITRSITPGGKTVEKEETYNLNNLNSINNLEDDLIKTIIGTNKDSQKARVYAHDSTKSLITGEEDFSLNEKSVNISEKEWRYSEEKLVGGEDEDDDDYQKGVLYKIYPNFKFEQAGFGTNEIVAISPNGENKTKELSTGNPEDYKVLIDFIKENSKEPKEIKTQAEFDKAYANLAPGESITAKGKTYTKPSKK